MPRNIIFGLLLLLQVIFIVLIEIQLFSNMDLGRSTGASGLLENISPQQWGKIVIFLIFASIASLAVIILGILHVVQNKAITEDGRLVWILVLLLAGVIGQTIYFFKHMVKQQPIVTSKSSSVGTTDRPNKDFWNT